MTNLLIQAAYCICIFFGSFLLFQVQPVFAKIILPWYGGTPNVWTSCLVFFQVFLFLGYLYSYLLKSFFVPRIQALVHLFLLLVALYFLDIHPEKEVLAGDSEVFSILSLLTSHIGLVYLILSTCSPLAQSWFSLAFPDLKVYRLYALSNLASFFALLSYPFLFEPLMTVSSQTSLWQSGYFIFSMLYIFLCIKIYTKGHQGFKLTKFSVPKDLIGSLLQIMALAATGVALLMAITNFICYDVAVIPFLWILPLSLYLLSYVLCFSDYKLYWKGFYTSLSVFCILAFSLEFFTSAGNTVFTSTTFSLLTLFSLCMFAHGEISLKKPKAEYLALFYFCIALGGALGGIFVGIIAPLVFESFLELELALAAVLFLIFWIHKQSDTRLLDFSRANRPKLYVLLFSFGFLGAVLIRDISEINLSKEQIRNFYGILRIKESKQEPIKLLQTHGRTVHGSELIAAKKKSIFAPTEYYGPNSGGGLAIRYGQKLNSINLGVVGMGVATLAGYGKKGDRIHFYEINPDVIRQAKEYFSFLGLSKADIKIYEGDARITLEDQKAMAFDILVLDAFSSDSIPVHLLTIEAFDIYLKHLIPKGLIAIHISNRYLDLLPVLKALCSKLNLEYLHIKDPGNLSAGTVSSDWVLISDDSDFLEDPAFLPHYKVFKNTKVKEVRLWTDDFSNLYQILK